jgi:hypothetical protein
VNVRFNCRDCAADVLIDSSKVTISLAGTIDQPDLLKVTGACLKGHQMQHLAAWSRHPGLIQELAASNARFVGSQDEPATATPPPFVRADFNAWLDSPAFDDERLHLRLQDGAA